MDGLEVSDIELLAIPDKIISNERAHGKQSRYGGALVREHVDIHGVVLGYLQAGGEAQLVGCVAQEGQVGHRPNQHQHVRGLQQ